MRMEEGILREGKISYTSGYIRVITMMQVVTPQEGPTLMVLPNEL